MTAPPIKHKGKLACSSKRRHPDELVARVAAMSAITMHRRVDVLYIYRCPHCRGWHLTSKPNGAAFKVTGDNPVHERTT